MYKKPNVDPFNHKELIKNAEFYDYATTANPISSGLIPEVPFTFFSPKLYQEGPTQVISLDMKEKLKVPYRATSPGLLANFVRIRAGEKIATKANATSEVFYVIRGNGHTDVGSKTIPWNTGDFFVLPANSNPLHHADIDSAFYWVHDEPLLSYLGAKADESRFDPTLYVMETAYSELHKVIEKSESKSMNDEKHPRSRLSVLLANKAFPQTRTITHTLWTMLGVLPANEVQYPHRHQSVALDFVVECQPGCYTLIGKKLGEDGEIIDPIRADWEPGAVFITPPGYWHSHHNESGVQAHVLPIQDAGLHTYLRTLAIQFCEPEHASFISLK